MTRLLLALDVDGTTVRHDGVTISTRVGAAVKAVHAAGHHVVLSTGRSPASTLTVTAALGLVDGFAVCSNGAVTLRLDPAEPGRYAVLAETAFDPKDVLAALRRRWPDAAVAVEVAGVRGFLATASFPSGELEGAVEVVAWDRLSAHGATRLMVYAAHSPEQVARIGRDLGLTCVQDTTGRPDAVEMGPHGVSKGSALEALRTTLGVAVADTLAVGDHVNDVEMLRWAARGIAMGHAPAVVKETAVEVAPSCDDDGLAVVLEALVPAGTSCRVNASRERQ